MSEQPRRRSAVAGAPSLVRRVAGVSLAMALVVVGLAVGARPTGAHTPHDNISDIAVSPTFGQDDTVWVIAANRLLKSTDRGSTWMPIVRGLPRPAEQGKSLARVVIAPSDPRVMYLSSRVGGFHRSTDGGASWAPANEGLPMTDITPIAVSPRSPDVVLAAGTISGLFRSPNGGRSWTAVPGFGRVLTVAFDADGSGRAFIGDHRGTVASSDDEGQTWARVATADGEANTIASAPGRDGSSVTFAGTDRGGLLESTDGGRSFVPVESNLPEQIVQAISFSPRFATDRTMWASLGRNGAYRSTDGGRRWTRQDRGLTTDRQADEVDVQQFSALSVAPNGGGDPVVFQAGFDGLFRSEDGGERWRSLETLAEYVVGLAVSPTYASDRMVVVTTYVKGAYVTADAGGSWDGRSDGLGFRLSEGNKFAPVKRLHNVVFSPDYANDGTIFSATWTHFLKSTDRGRSWTTIEVEPPPPQQLLRQFVIAVSPNYASDRTIFMGTRQGDIFRSDNRGDAGSWSRVGKTDKFVRSLLVSPSFSTDRTLFASPETGIVKSQDGGATWARTGPGEYAMLAMSPNYPTDGTVLAGTLNGLSVTRDGGGSWSELARPPLSTSARVEALAISPNYASDRTMLVSVGGDGLYRSVDGGDTFAAVAAELRASNHVIGDFTNPTSTPLQFSPSFGTDGTIYGYAGQDVVRSTDRGDTWAVLSLPSAAEFLRTAEVIEPAPGGEASGGGRSRSSTALLLGALTLAALALLAAAGWWVLSRHFVGVESGEVVVFRGRPGGMLGRRPQVVHRTGIVTGHLADERLAEVEEGAARGSRRAADRYVEHLGAEVPVTEAVGAPRS